MPRIADSQRQIGSSGFAARSSSSGSARQTQAGGSAGPTPQPPAPAKPTGKKPGAEPGHPLLMKDEDAGAAGARERCRAVVPEWCAKCDEALTAKAGAMDPEPKRHQRGFAKASSRAKMLYRSNTAAGAKVPQFLR